MEKEGQHSDSSVKQVSFIWMDPEQTYALLDMHKKKKTGDTVRYGVSDAGFGERRRRGLKFTDEPTGNLDSHTSEEVMGLMQRVVREQGRTLVMVTHDNHLAEYADRVFHIIDGKIVKIEENPRREREDVKDETV